LSVKRILLSFLTLFVLFFHFGCSTTAIREKRIESYLMQGVISAKEGEYEKALALYEAALEEFSDNEKLLYNKALTEYLAKKRAEALKTFVYLDSLANHSNENYLKAIVQIAKEAENYPLAIDSYYKMVSLNPQKWNNREALISLLEKEEKYLDAYLVAKEAFDLQLYSKDLLLKLSELEKKTKKGDGLSYLLLLDYYY